ncbi:MAG TPA: CBS domain-containing protein, partial [Nitrospiria bacterium]|nr:CBS domain-containing protein [Nitrospiria bacterium]
HLMERAVLSFEGAASCHDLAEAMVKGNFGCIPIVDREGKLVGVVTESDLLDILAKGEDLTKAKSQEWMSPPIAISESMSVKEIIALLQDRSLIRVPVVDPAGKLIGILARRDVLAGYIESMSGPFPKF